MKSKQELAKLLNQHKGRTGGVMQWLRFDSEKEAQEALAAIGKFHADLPGIDRARLSQTEDKKAWKIGLTRAQWTDIVEHHLAVVKEDKRTEQLKFVDYFIRNRTKTKHPASYQQRMELISQLASQQQVFFRPEFLPVYDVGHHKDHLKLGYKPEKHASYDSAQIDLAPGAAEAHYRHYTKYRMVYGPVPYYLDGFDEKPVLIDTISACAINLMGSSKPDEDKFMPGGRLDEVAYQEECRATAEFLLSTAKSRGADKLVMPAFGVGVYIKNLKNSDDKAKAKEIMNKAFAEMAQKYEVIVDWVVYKHAKNAVTEKAFLDSQTEGNPYMNHVITDLMVHAQQQNEAGFHCAMLNPGSDRTIGGAYTTENPDTLEEKMAQNSDLMFLHTVYNEDMIERFENDLAAAKKSKKEKSKEDSKLPLKEFSLDQKKAILARLAEEILQYKWEVVFGGKSVQGKQLPTKAAAIYNICISKQKGSKPEEQFVDQKIKDIVLVLSQTQQDNPLISFLRKLDFLHLFTRSDDTQKYYNTKHQFFKTQFSKSEEEDVDEKPKLKG